MQRGCCFLLWAGLVGGFGLLVPAANCQAQTSSDYKVTVLAQGPPKQLAAPIAAVMNKTGLRITDPSGKTLCDIWLRAELPLIAGFTQQLDLNYGIQPGTLIGAIRFPGDGSDFRQQKLKPGVYTIRYAHQPQDGDHLGTSDYRDFLVLCPPQQDRTLEPIKDEEKLNELSEKAADTEHPAILYLMPPPSNPAKLPAMVRNEDYEYELLVAETTAKEGNHTKKLVISIVLVGYALE